MSKKRTTPAEDQVLRVHQTISDTIKCKSFQHLKYNVLSKIMHCTVVFIRHIFVIMFYLFYVSHQARQNFHLSYFKFPRFPLRIAFLSHSTGSWPQGVSPSQKAYQCCVALWVSYPSDMFQFVFIHVHRAWPWGFDIPAICLQVQGQRPLKAPPEAAQALKKAFRMKGRRSMVVLCA